MRVIVLLLLTGLALTIIGAPRRSAAQVLSPTATASPAPVSPVAAAATPAGATTPAADTSPPVVSSENPNGGGASNIVNVVNREDNALRVRGAIQVNHIPGPIVGPRNQATAISSCTGCASFSVALQIDLISTTASQITPQNYAIAYNDQCTGCDTVACALQYVVQVADPTQTPDNVRSLIDEMQDQLQTAQQDSSLTQVEETINGVIDQFSSLAQSLYVQRQEAPESDTSQSYPC